MKLVHCKKVEINGSVFKGNKSWIYCFDEKEIDEKKISKNDERIIFSIVPLNQKLKEELFCQQPEITRIVWEFGLVRSGLVNQRPEEENSGTFFLNSSVENFNSFFYRYHWTDIDNMSREHKIVEIPNLGRTTSLE